MPGVILELKVKAGDTVKADQVILIMESMKMENEITSPRDGTVAQVVVEKGQTVATDDPLIILA
jgi:biotin carboxyl carrier protein